MPSRSRSSTSNKTNSHTNNSKSAPLLSPQTQLPLRFEYSDDLESFSIRQPTIVMMYDAESVLEIPRDVADGYLILLSGGLNSAKVVASHKQQTNKINNNNTTTTTSSGESTAQQTSSNPATDTQAQPQSPEQLSALSLAFTALTDGNVIEAVFGVQSTGGIKRNKHTSQQAYNAARNAKQALMEAACTSESIRLVAVETYIKCFEIIVKYHLEMDSIGLWSWCVKHQKLREDATRNLNEAFRPLHEGVAASS
mmetsp:Transcript_24921/g.30634  ORF Transcript_24921/g.30634 Transcript_24921/m.30634 type:complete len:253 (+) Transcript_24921:433-1191(+)